MTWLLGRVNEKSWFWLVKSYFFHLRMFLFFFSSPGGGLAGDVMTSFSVEEVLVVVVPAVGVEAAVVGVVLGAGAGALTAMGEVVARLSVEEDRRINGGDLGVGQTTDIGRGATIMVTGTSVRGVSSGMVAGDGDGATKGVGDGVGAATTGVGGQDTTECSMN
jgi:hypothetical protein